MQPAYTSQPPDSRFVRFAGPCGTLFITRRYRIPVIEPALLRYALRRTALLAGFALVAGCILILLIKPSSNSVVSGVTVSLIALCLSFVDDYWKWWRYWNTRLAVRLGREWVRVRVAGPFRRRHRRWRRDEIADVKVGPDSVLLLLDRRKRPIGHVPGTFRDDTVWLCETLRTELCGS